MFSKALKKKLRHNKCFKATNHEKLTNKASERHIIEAITPKNATYQLVSPKGSVY